MTRFAKLSLAAVPWIGAQIAYAFWYNRLLELPFTFVAAAFALLFAGWSFSALVVFRPVAARAVAFFIYVCAIAFLLLNFAYCSVFGKFLPFSFSRAGSLNGPMIELLREYVFLLPWSIVIGAGLLLGMGAWYAFVLAPKLMREQVPLTLVHDSVAAFHPSHNALRGIALALALQVVFIGSTVAAADGYRSRVAGSGVSSTDILANLGVFGYAIAAERGKFSAPPAVTTGAAAENAGEGLMASKTNIQTVRDAFTLLETFFPTPTEAAPTMSAAAPQTTPPNIIIYQMESVDAWALDQDPSPMPFLEAMMARYGRVDEYFANGCSTIDAEFVINCGFLPDTYGPVSDLYAANSYRCLPSLLKDRGYATAMYHANDPKFWARTALAPAWGYEEMHFSPEIPFRDTDSSVFDRVIDRLKAGGSKPTLAYVIGFTSHSPHGDELMRYYRQVKKLDVRPYAGALGETAQSVDADEATVRSYLGFLTAADQSLQHLFDRLDKEGLLRNTVVVAFGDHRYYDSKAQDPIKKFLDYNRIPFFLYAPGMQSATLAPIASHMDVPSTLWGLAAGADAPQLPASFLGHDLLSSGEPHGAVTKCLGQASYYDGQAIVSGDMAFNSFRVTPVAAGQVVPQSQSEAMIDALRTVALGSDLALKRNELGSATIPADPAADKKIRLDNLADTDGDGLSDLREATIGTDRKNPDTDGDGYSDGMEASSGFNPLGDGRWVREPQAPKR